MCLIVPKSCMFVALIETIEPVTQSWLECAMHVSRERWFLSALEIFTYYEDHRLKII